MFRKSSDGTHYRQSFFARNFRTSREAAERMKHGRIERPRKAALLRRDGLIHSPVPRCDGAGRRGLLDAAAEKYDGQGRGERLLTGRASRAGRDAATSSPTSGATTSRGATGCASVSLSIAGTVSSTPVASSITVRSSGGSSTGSAGFAASCGSSASGICGVSSCTGSSTCEETFSASLSAVFFGSSVQ